MAYPAPKLTPIHIEDLKVGMYIRLDCNWMKHPFPRNNFKIQSRGEIDVIRRLGGIAISLDASRSDPESLKQSKPPVKKPPVSQEATEASPDLCQLSAEVQAILKKKQEDIQRHLLRQEELKHATARHAETVHQTKEVIDQIVAGREGCSAPALAMIETMSDAIHGGGKAVAMLNVSLSDAYGPGNLPALHALNVFMVSMMLGKKFELKQQDMFALGIGALLHDIGERKVPTQVLAKQRKAIPLLRAEKTFFELHPEYGKRMVGSIEAFSSDSGELIYQHHERLDGSGYPRGIKGDAISLLAQIIMVADQYDHLTNALDTQKCLCPTEAFSRLYVNRGKLFSEPVVVCLIHTLSIYPPGTFVLLSDESIGMVTRTNFSAFTRPLVMIYEPDPSGENLVIVDLAEDKELSIKKTLRPTEVPAHTSEYWKSRKMSGYFVHIKDDLLEAMSKQSQ